MKTTITGGAGFIGSHLTDYLLAEGDEVTVLDDLSTGSLDNLAEALDSESFSFIEGSVLDQEAVRRAVAGADRVFHLAAAVGVQLIVEQPLQSLRTNIHGTENVLNAALAEDAVLVLASTSEVYGKNASDSLDEEADRILGSALKSRWTYAGAKGIDEAFAHAYWSELGLKVAIVRLFNTVGPRQTGRYGMVVPNLVGQALAGAPLTVFGDGLQSRCFSYVGDVVPALVRLSGQESAFGQAFNLGGAQEVSILELAERIVERTGSDSSITLVPYEQAYSPGYEDMRRRVPNNSKANGLIGFVPGTNVDRIIDLVAEDLRQRGSLEARLMGKPGALAPLAAAG
ncbi:NAD-dependent epimerase/dehydratase family protein [Zafaria sp. J156]|uniref:NAD-dependent epimerase/dehydratase family protein n=1 Tax=Zafaria sp. J156 TaxID=3116490 RepID=UPI002E77FD92|nr:NAD-dependent epimerase/dehydratase family protein [Zafaria sp. J156]MEE1620520.1 NAD-dependent epimerase/dehydratase family protein [Zafaria sp. J156]